MPAQLSQRRLLAEMRALTARYPEIRMGAPELGAPTFEVSLTVEGTLHPVRMVLPPGYPGVPPEVRELVAPGGEVRETYGVMHRFADGTMCLFPHGNDAQGWNPDHFAADALDQCTVLLRTEHAEGEERQLVFPGLERLIIAPGAAQLFRVPQGRGTMALLRGGKEGHDLFVADIRDEVSQLVVRGIDPLWARLMAPVGEALWVRVEPDGRTWEARMHDAATLRAFLAAALPEALARRALEADPLVLVPAERDGCEAWLVRRLPEQFGAVMSSKALIVAPDDLLFRRVDGVLSRRDLMADVGVVIVGLGSLGGAVAVALARSGFCRFVLVDPDRLSLENVSRHVGTTRDLGRRKVEIIADAIVAVNPRAEVTRIAKALAWDMPGFAAGAEFAAVLEASGKKLVITTCAVGRVERQINALALRCGIPAIYAAVLGPGEHGRVFRVIPGESACYECVRQAQQHRPEEFPAFPDDGTGDGQAYGDPGLPGLAIDVGQIALITARFALQTVARVYELDLGMKDEAGDHLLWTNRGGWGFDRPLQIEVVRVPKGEACPACGQAKTDELSTAEAAELERLVMQAAGPRGRGD